MGLAIVIISSVIIVLITIGHKARKAAIANPEIIADGVIFQTQEASSKCVGSKS